MEQKELCSTAEAVENIAPTELVPVTLNVRRNQVGMLQALGGEVFLQSILQQINDDELEFYLPLSVLTDEQKEEFIKGWRECNTRFEDEIDRPWHEPWKWPQLEAIEVHSVFPKLWGYNWCVECEAYIFGDEDDFDVEDDDEDEDDENDDMDPKDRMLRFLKDCEVVRLNPEYKDLYV